MPCYFLGFLRASAVPSAKAPSIAASSTPMGFLDSQVLVALGLSLLGGLSTSIGISLHNFPEGMAVFLGLMKGLRVGLNLALAIALHNIPDGVAVARPVYFATQRFNENIITDPGHVDIYPASRFPKKLHHLSKPIYHPSSFASKKSTGLDSNSKERGFHIKTDPNTLCSILQLAPDAELFLIRVFNTHG